MARPPYELVKSLAQGLPELITSPTFRVIFIFIRTTIRSDYNFFAVFLSKTNRERAGGGAHSNKRGERDAEERRKQGTSDRKNIFKSKGIILEYHNRCDRRKRF